MFNRVRWDTHHQGGQACRLSVVPNGYRYLNMPAAVLFFKGEKCHVKETEIGYWILQTLFLLCPYNPDKSLKFLMFFKFYIALLYSVLPWGCRVAPGLMFHVAGRVGCRWCTVKGGLGQEEL